MKKVLSFALRLLVYLVGLLLIAVGINFSKMSGLGISPVSSIPRALEVVWGLTLGTTTIIAYCVMVGLQALILRRRFKLKNILGIPVAVVFGWMVDFVGIDDKAFGHLLAGFPRPEGYLMQFLYLLVSLVIIGVGVFTYLRPSLVPMPGEGLAQAISEVSGKKFGDCKTAVDMSFILVALVLQLVFLGGFSSFADPATTVVREGTFLSALLIGQIVKLLSRLFPKR